VVMVCPPKGFKVDLDNQPLTMTTRLLPPADAFAHKSAHYPLKPSGGGCGGGIAPYSGVDGVPFIPLDGVMRTPIRTFPAPPAGDYLDIAICIGGNNHETACR
jgi:hypothetical protein